MNIYIEVIDVKDADAIIVCLKDVNRNLIVLIDGGKVQDANKVIRRLKVTLKREKKKAPDIVINTHYDSDHIGGLYKIIREFGNDIQEVWMHEVLRGVTNVAKKSKAESENTNDIFYSFTDLPLKELSNKAILNSTYGSQLITTVQQQNALSTLIKTFKNIKVRPLFTKKSMLKEWPELEVLGPSRSFYKKHFPKKLTESFMVKEILVMKEEKNHNNNKKYSDSCSELDKSNKIISSVNIVSGIIMVSIKGKKFLFAADAGVQSLKSIKRYTSTLKKLFWLKIPHHGSDKNIDSKLLFLMNPQVACISGNKRISNNVVDCLTKVCRQVSTTKTGTQTFEYNF